MLNHLKPIQTLEDHASAMAEIARLWGAKKGTVEGHRLDALATLIDTYESAVFPFDQPKLSPRRAKA